MKKRLFAFLLVLVFGGVLPLGASAEGFLTETIAGLKAQIAELEARLAQLQGLEVGETEQGFLNRNYQLGETGPEVIALQDFLRAKGFFSLPQSTGYFGEVTQKALRAYTESLGKTVTPVTTVITTTILATSTPTTTPLVVEKPLPVTGFGFKAVKPPAEAIDARSPVSLEPNSKEIFGWQEFEFAFTPDPKTRAKKPVLADFGVETAKPDFDLKVVAVVASDPVVVKLSQPIPAGVWTKVIHKPTQTTFRFGYLPGDVNQDALVSYEDLLLLIDVVNKVKSAPDYTADIDRNGLVNRADQLAWLNLVKTSEGESSWHRHSLPSEVIPS